MLSMLANTTARFLSHPTAEMVIPFGMASTTAAVVNDADDTFTIACSDADN